jgi:hypothetical protein
MPSQQYCPLYHGENKLHFVEVMMFSVLYQHIYRVEV